MITPSKHRLVMGIGPGMAYSLLGNPRNPDEYVPDAWEKVLPWLDHDILVSAQYSASQAIKAMQKVWDPKEHLFVDSGGFTLYRKQLKMGFDNPEFKKICDQAARTFLRFITKVAPKVCFELDNEHFRVDEDMLSPRNYLRQEVKDILGYYPVPVFKMHQGFEYWKALCDSDLYPRLSIGGFAATGDWHTMVPEVRTMMLYARAKGKWVHLLGCANLAAFRAIQPDSVDYNIHQLGLNIIDARTEHPELTDDLPWREVMHQVALWSVTRAICRSHYYDGFREIEEDDEAESI